MLQRLAETGNGEASPDRDILGACWHVGAMLGHGGPGWASVGAMFGPSWSAMLEACGKRRACTHRAG